MKIEYVKDGNVISIDAARTGMKYPAVLQAEAYWEGLRNGRVMPSRSDVDPRGISNILEQSFILEKIAPGMAKIRLAGQGMNDILGMEMRGMPITSLLLPEARGDMRIALERLFDSPATVHLTLKSAGGFTRSALDAQMFLAPLRDDQGRATRAIGAIQIKGNIDRAPRRFNISKMDVTEILTNDVSAFRNKNALSDPQTKHPYLQREDVVKKNTSADIPGYLEHAKGSDLRQNRHSRQKQAQPHLRVVEPE